MACILNLLFLRETRSDILLSRRAARLTKETGVLHVCRGYDTKKTGLRVIAISCLRPMSTSNLSHPVLGLMEGFLVTEPIVSALSIWIAFAWAMVFLSGTSVMLVFQQYEWSTGQLGLAQV